MFRTSAVSFVMLLAALCSFDEPMLDVCMFCPPTWWFNDAAWTYPHLLISPLQPVMPEAKALRGLEIEKFEAKVYSCNMVISIEEMRQRVVLLPQELGFDSFYFETTSCFPTVLCLADVHRQLNSSGLLISRIFKP